MLGIKYQVSGAWNQVHDFWCLELSIWFLVLGIKYLVSGAWNQVSGFYYLEESDWCIQLGIKYPDFAA